MATMIKAQNGNIYELLMHGKNGRAIVGRTACSVLGQVALGKYETEDRAKEVMKEIEEHIRRKYSEEQLSERVSVDLPEVSQEDGEYFIKEQKKLAIFTMPKE